MSVRTPMLIALLLLLATAGGSQAAAPEFHEDEDRLVLENGFVTLWFERKKPLLTILPSGDEDGGFTYHFTRLVEFRDLDGDKAPGENEIVASLDLAAAEGWTSKVEPADGTLAVRLMLQAPVQLARTSSLPTTGVPVATGQASLAIVATLSDAADRIVVDGVETMIPATAARLDLEIAKWPFVDADGNRLALVAHASGALDVANATGLAGAAVLADEIAQGSLAWATIAEGNSTAGEAVDVPVRVVTAPHEEGTVVTMAYDAGGIAGLRHVQIAGTLPADGAAQEATAVSAGALKAVPATGLLAAGLAVAAAAVARTRR